MEQSAAPCFYLSVEKRCLIFSVDERQGEVSESLAACMGISVLVPPEALFLLEWLIFSPLEKRKAYTVEKRVVYEELKISNQQIPVYEMYLHSAYYFKKQCFMIGS